jgi:hypothetical protein
MMRYGGLKLGKPILNYKYQYLYICKSDIYACTGENGERETGTLNERSRHAALRLQMFRCPHVNSVMSLSVINSVFTLIPLEVCFLDNDLKRQKAL